ncbi:MAG: 3-deoxy-7-phosphoheptulonate synthase [Liquorilactobacillus satsumensis]
MIIVLKEKVTENIARLQQLFADRKQVFVHKNRVALLAVEPSEIPADIRAAASEIITKTPAAVQASRLFHPEDTVIKTAHSVIGAGGLTLMAGPCSVESRGHILKMAAGWQKGGATVLRGGAFKPRTSPYSFQGLEEEGLQYLREAADQNGMDVITEVMDDEHVELVAKYTDIFQIGARNMQNFSLLKAVGKTQIPVALKRGMSATLDDLLNASEYIAAGGNQQIMLVERGIRTFANKYTRNTFDAAAIPVLQQLTHYPVIADPSHAVGHWDLVTPLAVTGVAAGAAGLLVEIHDDPEHALSDGPQALKPGKYLTMAQHAKEVHQVLAAWK